jgi:hypothetical protein
MDRTKAKSTEELRANGLERIREGVAVVEQKATPEELADYRRFVLTVANRVAGAKKESDDKPVSDAEAAAITEISEALGA